MLNRIKSLLKGKDAKTLFENFISLSALQVIGMFLPLVTLPYVLRVLGFQNYGIIVLASSLVAYFQSITDYSFKVTATRDVAVFKSSPLKLNLIYSKVLTVKALFLLMSFMLITLIVFLYPPFYKERTVFFLTMPLLLGYAIFPEWFFQGIEKMRYITFLNLGIKVFFTLCIFIFVKEKEDYWIYPLLQSAGYIGAGALGQYILVRKYKIKFILLKGNRIKQTIFSNFPVFVNRFLPTLYNNTSTFLLGILTTTTMVGTYDAIRKIIDLFISFLNVISQVFFPFLNRRKDAFNRYKKMMLSISALLTIIVIASHHLVFRYLDVHYEHAFIVLLCLSLGLIGIAVYDIFGMNYFIVYRKDKLVMKNVAISSIIGFVLAFPLIYYWGIIGAAINLSLCRLLMGGGLYFKYLRYSKLSYPNPHEN